MSICGKDGSNATNNQKKQHNGLSFLKKGSLPEVTLYLFHVGFCWINCMVMSICLLEKFITLSGDPCWA